MAGLPLVGCLKILSDQQENKAFKKHAAGNQRFGADRINHVGIIKKVPQDIR